MTGLSLGGPVDDSSPVWLTHQIDFDAGKVYQLHTSWSRLRAARFLDGRSDFTLGTARAIGFTDYLARKDLPRPFPLRMIFHMGFCGSTHFARLLDGADCAAVLKEPHALVDLANRAALGLDDVPLRELCLAILDTDGDGPRDRIAKPSNWANNLLLPLLAERAEADRFILITCPRRSFLQAAFRGGRDRLAYIIKCAAHLSAAVDRNADFKAALEGDSPLDTAARCGVLLHHLQRSIFDSARRLAPDIVLQIAHEEIVRAPLDSLRAAARHLNLPVSEQRCRAAVARGEFDHAKIAGRRFSLQVEAQENTEVDGHYGSTIDAALTWSDLRFSDR